MTFYRPPPPRRISTKTVGRAASFGRAFRSSFVVRRFASALRRLHRCLPDPLSCTAFGRGAGAREAPQITSDSARAASAHGYRYKAPRRYAGAQADIADLAHQPFFSVILLAQSVDETGLDAAVRSVTSQWYAHWEILPISPCPDVLADCCSRLQPLSALERLPEPSADFQAACGKACGDFVVFLQLGDELTVDCLYELALCANEDAPDLIYSDHDVRNGAGNLAEPCFKPDWSPDTLMSLPYVADVCCIRRSVALELSPSVAIEGDSPTCAIWDLLLQLAERSDRVSHIARVLYHQRPSRTREGQAADARLGIDPTCSAVRLAALARRGLSGWIEALPGFPGAARVRYAVQGQPLVSIVIPSRDNWLLLRRCLDSVRRLTSYPNIEIIVLDNGSVDPATLVYLQALQDEAVARVIRHDAAFNFSELNNLGARAARGDILLFLNDDTEAIDPDWLSRLVGFAQLPHIGAVGAKLLYPGGERVQHVGVVNLRGGPHHAFLNCQRDDPGHLLRNQLEANWSAVTGACLMIARDKFDQVGGFSVALAVAYNDIDLCFRLRRHGFVCVVVPAALLLHHESASRGADSGDPQRSRRLDRERMILYRRNPEARGVDPYHNPNLDQNDSDFLRPRRDAT